MIFKKELKLLENKKNSLEKKEIDLIVTDFDNTIFCRKEQLEAEEAFRLHRWEEWNRYVKDVYWIEKMVNNFYIWKDFPSTITSKLRENHDLILTKWMYEFASEKIKWLKLDRFNFIVVDEAVDKIITTIEYVVNTLWFIPSKITIYEDRPEYFVEHKNIIEDYLGTKVEIMYVEMIDNYTEPKIKKID